MTAAELCPHTQHISSTVNIQHMTKCKTGSSQTINSTLKMQH